MKNHPDNPKLTAYVLNELNDKDRAEIEELIRNDPETSALVDEIRRTSDSLYAAFGDEAELGLATEQRRKLLNTAQKPVPLPSKIPLPMRIVVTLGVAAAAIFVLLIGVREHFYTPVAVETDHGPEITFAHEKSELATPELERKLEELEEFADQPVPTVVIPEVVNKRVSGKTAELGDQKLSQVADDSYAAVADMALQVKRSESDRLRSQSEASRMRMSPPAQAAPVLRPYANTAGMAAGGVVVYSMGPSLDMVTDRDAYSLIEEAEAPADRTWISPSLDDFSELRENPFRRVNDHPLSTFSIDVDTASYSVVRRFLSQGRMPPKDAVRIEELVNYFPYDYAPPTDGRPFAAAMEMTACPWTPAHKLVRVALKGRELSREQRPPANLVFLLDVSGSMSAANKLPLVIRSMQALTQQLDERDHVAIVVYAGAAGLVLPPTNGREKEKILGALGHLQAGGSTAGGQGIKLAYEVARRQFRPQTVNRVILCTDGDFNVGLTQRGDLERLIEEQAKSGVFLTVLGFGMGNYKDSTLELLSNKGNGNYGYIDDFNEARKMLVDQMLGTLVTIAKDVKIQVEFNPAQVSAYRLLGYENRKLKKEDFNNDKIDAGDIGAGHTVTAFYELVPAGTAFPEPEPPPVDALKYQPPAETPMVAARAMRAEAPALIAEERAAVLPDEVLTLKLRYKESDAEVSSKLEFTLPADSLSATPSNEFRFATAVAGFGMLLRDSQWKGSLNYAQVLEMAAAATGTDPFGYRAEFQKLVRNARAISGQ